MSEGPEPTARRRRAVERGEPQAASPTGESTRYEYYLDRYNGGWRYELRSESELVTRSWRPTRRWAKHAARRSIRRQR